MLSEYYKSLGQALPSVQERAKIAEQYGITGYRGTAEQNNALEAKLRAGGGTTVPTNNQNTPATQNTPSGGSSGGNYDLNSVVDAMMSKGYNNRAEAEAVAKGDLARYAKEYLGVSDGSGGSSALQTTPTVNLTEQYNKLISESGIGNNEATITSKQNEITALKNAAADREAEVNENPFLSESSRVGRIQKINDNLAKKLAPLETEITNLSNANIASRNEILTKLNLNVQQASLDNSASANSLSKFNTLLAAGALSNLSATDIAKLSTETGLPVSMINSAIAQSKVGEPQIITQTDNNGNVTAVSIDKKTGKIMNSVSLGQIGEAKTPAKATTAELKQGYANLAKTDARNGVTLQQMLQIYGGYLDPNDIYALYNANSIYGAAKEDEASLQKWGINPKSSSSAILSALLGGQ